jgi:class 3 adenylate cyclase
VQGTFQKIDSLISLGTEQDRSEASKKYVRYANAASILALVTTLFFFALELPIIADLGNIGLREATIITLRFLASFGFVAPLVMNHRGHQASARLVFGIWAILFTLGLVLLYGANAPSHLFFIAIIAGFVAMFPEHERSRRALILTSTFVAFGLSFLMCHYLTPIVEINRPAIRVVVELAVSFGALTLVLALAFAQRNANDQAEAAVVAQKEKADRLLLNILPEAVAQRLKESSASIADGFDEVTVMFADLVGFTPLSQSMEPRDLVALMDRIFSEFDKVVEKLGLEKIKTIGDAYMVAGGIPTLRDDHAQAIAKMALEILPIIDAFSAPGGESLQLRIGIASGSAVAGVIGRKKFAYDLWGDTVNTASRMESHGEPGKIQVNENTYQRLKDEFEFIERGLVEVKGKGQIPTWYLVGHRTSS